MVGKRDHKSEKSGLGASDIGDVARDKRLETFPFGPDGKESQNTEVFVSDDGVKNNLRSQGHELRFRYIPAVFVHEHCRKHYIRLSARNVNTCMVL